MKTRVVTTGLLSAFLMSSVPLNADGGNDGVQNPSFHKPSIGTTALLLGAGAPLVLLHARRSVKDFKSRFDWEKFKKNPLSTEGAQQLWYAFYDEFIGQKSVSSKVKANKEDGSLVVSAEAQAAGFVGNAHEYIKPMENTGTTLAAGYFGYLLLMNPNAIWKIIEPKDAANRFKP